MNVKTWVLLVASAVFTGYVGWGAAQPDGYLISVGQSEHAHDFAGWYLVVAVVYCGLLFALLRPWRAAHSVIGATLAVVITIASSFFAGYTAMHAHPAHGSLIIALIIMLVGLLVYSGYCFAHWRVSRAARPASSDQNT